jgi:hypothetical protein
VRQLNSEMPSSRDPAAQAVEPVDEPHCLMRGVMYGLILVLPIWLAIGYATLIRR